jgi:molybdopterin converting factor small subunit
MGIFDRHRGGSIRVHVLIKGRIGDGWVDVDEHLRVPVGTTLASLVDAAQIAKVPLREAIDNSPHLRDTLMLNGERCAFDENKDRALVDGDEIYLLSPLAGG